MDRRRWRVVLPALLCGALVAGCGSRLDGADVVASGRSDTVALTPESLEALRGSGPVVAAQQPQAAVPADAAVATAEEPATTGSQPTGSQTERRDAGGRARTAQADPAPAADTGTAASRGADQAAAAKAAAPGAAKQNAGTAAAGAQRCTRELAPIPIGHIGTFSGVAGPLTASAVTTMAAWAQDVNARGGLACHPVRVFTRDDGADPARAAALANELVERRGVVAFVGTLVLSPAGFIQAVQKLKVPVVGGGVGQDSWFTTPYFYPDVAHADDLIAGLLKQGVERGKKKLGILYCVEAPACAEIPKKVKAGAAEAAGAELVYETAVSVTQTDYTAQCLNAQKAGADLLGLGVDGASMTRVVRSCAAIGYRPLIATASFLIGTAQSKDEGLRSFGVVTAAGTAPWFEKGQPGLREYQRALARWAPNLVADGASISTWTSAKLFEAAIANVAAQARETTVGPELIETGVGKVRRDSLGGLTGPLDFTSPEARRTGSGCVFYQYLGADCWSAPNGSKPVCLRR